MSHTGCQPAVWAYKESATSGRLVVTGSHPEDAPSGDVLNLTADTIAVGISERSSPDGIEGAARRLFADEEASVRTVLAFDIPASRAFMHLDTVFTQIDRAKYIVHPAIIGPLTVYEITPGRCGSEELHIERIDAPLESILEKYTGEERVKLIHCGGDDMIAAAREQWNDGSNTLCVAPGRVIVYELSEMWGESSETASAPTLNMEFSMDYAKTAVLTFGFNEK